jgi:CHASE3 domain sensor protein
MTNANMFEVAVRTKMRFTFKGVISVEDLWDLSVENLDAIFKTLNSQLKQVKEESLLSTKTKEDKELDVKIEIVKYIVNVKLEERDKQQKAKEQKEKKQKILELISNKQDEALQNKSVEELQAMLNELDN